MAAEPSQDSPRRETEPDGSPPRRATSDVAMLLKWLVVLLAVYGGATAYRRWGARPGAEFAKRDAGQSAGEAAQVAEFSIQYVSPEEYVERPVVVPGPGAIVLPRTLDNPPPAPPAPDSDFVATETCGECHADKLASFQKTAHFQTLRVADSTTVLGSFEPGRNVLATSELRLRFEMEREPDGMFQKLIFEEKSGEKFERRQRIDLVSGSGKVGQTYLSWWGDQLFELPVSYFTEEECWTNSPGYMDGVADFARPAIPRCLECHATYARQLPGAINRYDPASLIPGVTCQRCHGPGREHVAFHRAHRDETEPRAIINPSELTRERQMQVCEQCHSGKSTLRKAAFSYRPGEPLHEHLQVSPQGRDIRGQVHTANQSARITLSRCFQASERMTCATCHDPHRLERGDLATFSAKCRQCHDKESCRQAPRQPDNCVDCHMPRGRETDSGITKGGGSPLAPPLRDHWIKVWPETTPAP